MSGGRAGLTGLLALSLVITLLPVSSAAPVSLAPLASVSPSAFRLDLASVPGSGAMLLAATSGSSVEFFEVAEDGSLPAARLAAFEISAAFDEPALAAFRLAVASPTRVAFAYESAGAARLTVVDPYLGEVVADLALSLAGEAAAEPSVSAAPGGFVASYLALNSASRVVVVRVSAEGTLQSRSALLLEDAISAALLAAEPSPYLAVLRPTSLGLFSIPPTGAPVSRGSLDVAASAGALWARAGSLRGLLSTDSGLVRVAAPLDAPADASLLPIAGGAGALEVKATDSADGMLLAAVRTTGATLILREEGVGEFSSFSLARVRAAAAAPDSFGLARAALLEGFPPSGAVSTLTAGDPDAVAVAIEGPSTVLPADTARFTLHLRAVRSPLTVVGLAAALPSGWSGEVPAVSLALARGAQASVEVTVAAPAGAAPGRYLATFTPAVLEIPSPSSASATLTVPATSAVEIGCCLAAVDLAPGESTVLTVSVLNRGAAAVVSQVTPEAPPGLLVMPSSTTVTIAAGATAQVSLTVSVLQGSPPVEGGTLTVQVRDTDGSPQASLALPARVRAVFAPLLTFAPRDISAAPGELVALAYAMVNTGNLGGYVRLEPEVTGLPPSSLSSPAGLVFVPAFSKLDLPVTLAVPPGSLAGVAYRVGLSAFAAVDGASAGGPLELAGSVRARAAFDASFANGPAAVPGGETAGTLTLTNLGNTPLTFSLAFDGIEAGFGVRVADGATGGIAVPAHGAASVRIISRVPALASPGPRTTALTVTAGAGPALRLDLPLEVAATHGIFLSMLTSAISFAGPGATTGVVDFEVANSGNAPTQVSLMFGARLVSLSRVSEIGVASPADPGALAPVPAHGALTFRAALAPQFAQGSVLARASVTVESTAGDTAAGAVDFTILKSDPGVADITVIGPADARAGNLHHVLANISNAGPGDAADFDTVLSVDGLVVGREHLDLLKGGQTRLVIFDFVPRKSSTELAVALAPRGALLDRDPSNNALSLTYGAAVPDATPPLAPPAAAPVAASLSLFALVALALSEIGKSTLISVLFLPLYVKLKPEEVLDQYLRGQIHGYIIANPGEHYNAIKDQLSVTNGALAYHLRVLERAGLVRSNRDGMYKRFYPMGVKIPKRRRLSSFQEAVVKAVRDNPAVSQKRIAELLGVSNQVVNYHVKQLEEAGILKVDRSERASKVFLGPEAPPAEGPLPPTLPPPAPAGPAGP